MTDNEIIKALNYCCGNIKNNDEECNEDMCYQVTLPESRDEGIRWCRQWLIKDALDLINRQKAEIESLQKNIDGLNIFTKNHIKVIRLQAMKEFAERLKDEMRLEDDCQYDCMNCLYECKGYVLIIDNLVKEMTEQIENE